jgi:hypothetical protein
MKKEFNQWAKRKNFRIPPKNLAKGSIKAEKYNKIVIIYSLKNLQNPTPAPP